jgi:hypothetical protein
VTFAPNSNSNINSLTSAAIFAKLQLNPVNLKECRSTSVARKFVRPKSASLYGNIRAAGITSGPYFSQKIY